MAAWHAGRTQAQRKWHGADLSNPPSNAMASATAALGGYPDLPPLAYELIANAIGPLSTLEAWGATCRIACFASSGPLAIERAAYDSLGTPSTESEPHGPPSLSESPLGGVPGLPGISAELREQRQLRIRLLLEDLAAPAVPTGTMPASIPVVPNALPCIAQSSGHRDAQQLHGGTTPLHRAELGPMDSHIGQ